MEGPGLGLELLGVCGMIRGVSVPDGTTHGNPMGPDRRPKPGRCRSLGACGLLGRHDRSGNYGKIVLGKVKFMKYDMVRLMCGRSCRLGLMKTCN